MPIVIQCRCGKKTRVRDSVAGKRIKCPGCGQPVLVPQPEVEEYADVYEDELDPYTAPVNRPRASKKKSQGKKKSRKKTSGGNLLPLLVVGGVIAGVVVAAGLAYAFLSRGKADPAKDATSVASEDVEAILPPTASLIASGNDAGGATPSGHDATASTSGHDAARSGHDAAQSTVSSGFPPESTASPRNAGDMWVVLSDFKEQQGSGIAKTLNVSYRVAAGQQQSGQQYVLFVGSSMGMMTRYQEVELDLNNRSGTVAVPVSTSMSKLKAYVALKTGPRDWQPVSGEIEVGGAMTAARRPPTVQESAGAAAQGMMFALANGRFEDGRIGGKSIVVDYVMQQQIDHGFQYYIVIKGQGDPIGAMISTALMRAKVGEKDELGIRQMGRPFPGGSLTAQIVKRRGMLDRDEEVVSNTVSISR